MAPPTLAMRPERRSRICSSRARVQRAFADKGETAVGPRLVMKNFDQGASKPFDFITANDVGDEINDANAFAASS